MRDIQGPLAHPTRAFVRRRLGSDTLRGVLAAVLHRTDKPILLVVPKDVTAYRRKTVHELVEPDNVRELHGRRLAQPPAARVVLTSPQSLRCMPPTGIELGALVVDGGSGFGPAVLKHLRAVALNRLHPDGICFFVDVQLPPLRSALVAALQVLDRLVAVGGPKFVFDADPEALDRSLRENHLVVDCRDYAFPQATDLAVLEGPRVYRDEADALLDARLCVAHGNLAEAAVAIQAAESMLTKTSRPARSLDPTQLREAIAAGCNEIAATNDALKQAVSALLVGQQVTGAAAEIWCSDGSWSIELSFEDGSSLEVPGQTHASGPLAEVVRAAGGNVEDAEPE